MRRKQWKISGIDIFDKGYSRTMMSRGYDVISIISMTLHLMKDIEWISEVWIFDELRLSLTFHIKEGVIPARVENIIKTSVVRIKDYLKGVGLSVGYHIDDDEAWRLPKILQSKKFMSISYWPNWEPTDQEKDFWSAKFEDDDIRCYEPSGM